MKVTGFCLNPRRQPRSIADATRSPLRKRSAVNISNLFTLSSRYPWARLLDHPANKVADLLPWNWEANLEPKAAVAA
jgi:hypothetical protein